ncbi:MAG: NusG domain II-containing protein [Clostridia bacterium]|nr:NusG domain II-containing protein [Clostridia bacterium]
MNRLKNKFCLGDLVAAALVLLLGFSVFAVSYFGKSEGDVCVLRTPDTRTVLPLSEDTEFDITSNGIDLHIVVENGKARVESSDCPDKICVHRGEISKSGQSAVCVPARLSLVIESEGESDADFIIG